MGSAARAFSGVHLHSNLVGLLLAALFVGIVIAFSSCEAEQDCQASGGDTVNWINLFHQPHEVIVVIDQVIIVVIFVVHSAVSTWNLMKVMLKTTLTSTPRS